MVTCGPTVDPVLILVALIVGLGLGFMCGAFFADRPGKP